MANYIFPIDTGGAQLAAGAVPASSGSTYGTHYSYLGVGGYVEVPNVDYMYDIPTGSNINPDGYSSGRRRLGMMVYVLSQSKLYQLLPLKSNGSRVSESDWSNASEAQQLVWLDPEKTVFDFSTFQNLSGTGNAADAWKELTFSGTSVTGATLANSVLEITQDDGTTVSVDLSQLEDTNTTVSGGTYNAGTLSLNRNDGSTVDISLEGLTDTIVDSASLNTSTNTLVFSSTGGGSLFSVDVSALTTTNDFVVSGATSGQTDIVTEAELTSRINTEFSTYLDDNVNNLL